MQKTIAFAVFTDLHMGVHSSGDYWLDESKKWAKWFVAKCAELGIKQAAFGGDFYHQRHDISVKTLNASHAFQEIFANSCLTDVWAIAGNHDCYFRDNNTVNSIRGLAYPFKVFDNTSSIVLLSGQEIAFVPWGCELPEKKVDIMIGHFDTQGFKMQKTRLSEHGYAPTELVKKAPLVISGHYHIRQSKKYDDGEMVYAGTPFQFEFGDIEEPKGFMVVYTDGTYDFVDYQEGPEHVRIKFSTLDADMLALQGKTTLHISLDFDAKPETPILEVLEKVKTTLKPIALYSITTYDGSLVDVSGVSVPAKTETVSELFTSYVESIEGVSEDTKKAALNYILQTLETLK